MLNLYSMGDFMGTLINVLLPIGPVTVLVAMLLMSFEKLMEIYFFSSQF